MEPIPGGQFTGVLVTRLRTLADASTDTRVFIASGELGSFGISCQRFILHCFRLFGSYHQVAVYIHHILAYLFN